MAAVDQHREPDARRPAEVHQRVHRRADRAAREQHVVDQHHGASGDVEADARLVHLGRLGPQADVIAVEGDVEHAHRHRGALDALDLGGEPGREVVAAVRDAHEHDVIGALVALDDLVGDAGEGAANVVGVEQRARHAGHGPAADTGTPAQGAEQAHGSCVMFDAPFPASRDRT